MSGLVRAVTAPGALPSSSTSDPNANQHIQVFVRVRPMNSMEVSKNSTAVLDCPGHKEVVVKERSTTCLTKTFTFDRAFGPNSKQIDVYRAVVSPLLEEVLLGYNCTVFAYGQTGTGKTFTMEGERTPDKNLTWENDPLSGIVPRAMSQLFDQLRLQGSEFTVRVSLLELYNEELFDLLSSNEKVNRTLRLYEDTNRKGSVIIQGLEEVTVHTKHEVYQIMERGAERRKTATTQMNANSSRSHTVFTVTVHIKESSVEAEELLKIGKLNFVDLAGSENIGRSGAVDKRAREAGSINQSLLTLGRVITALVERAPHVPYRESKLTRLLQDSLGGRTKTSIIATVSPASINVEETLSTLDYAHRAKNITNRPEINQKLTKRAMLKAYTEEIERLRRDLVATRDKNGVYVDPENYEQMLAQIENQGQSLANRADQIRVLEENLVVKDVEIASINAQWDETKDDLSTVRQLLEETRNQLRNTQARLAQVEWERDENQYKVQKHVTTEKNLSLEARRLLSTADETTSHLDKLYTKLERKRDIEADNLSAGQQFKQDLSEQIDSLCHSLDSFRTEHASFCGVQRMKLDDFLVDKENQFSEIVSSVREFLKNTTDFYSESTLRTDRHISTIVSLNTKAGDSITSIADSTTTEIETFTQGFIVKETKALENQLACLLRKIQDECNSFTSQLKKQANLVSQYVENRIMKLEQNRKTMESFLLHQIERNDLAVQDVATQQDRTEAYVETVQKNAASLIAQCNKMVSDAVSFKEMAEADAKTLIANLVESKADVQNFLNAVKNDFDVHKIEVEMLRNVAVEMANNGISEAEYNMESILDVYTGEAISHFRNKLEDNARRQQESWQLTKEVISCHTEDCAKSVSLFTEAFQGYAQANMSSIEVQGTELVKSLNECQLTDSEMVTRCRNEMKTHCKTVSSWAEETRALMQMQFNKLNEFWTRTYKTDTPTGVTPQKKRYSYPRVLSSTTYSPRRNITFGEASGGSNSGRRNGGESPRGIQDNPGLQGIDELDKENWK